jgi:hypothetical protein
MGGTSTDLQSSSSAATGATTVGGATINYGSKTSWKTVALVAVAVGVPFGLVALGVFVWLRKKKG